MCGIAGMIGIDTRDCWPVINDMLDAMAYRGPDARDVFRIGRDVTLGHVRLAVIEPTPDGAQPMRIDNLVCTYNGEIYNFRELRAFLSERGIECRTKTDTEVFIRMFAAFGDDAFHLMDGQFAAGIYNTDTRELTLVRDRAGEKPLYWMQRNGLFAFASELHALAQIPGQEWDIDPQAFSEYLVYRYVPAPRSILKGVQKLKPGHILKVRRDGEVIEKRWFAWEVNPDASASQEGFQQVCEEIESVLVVSTRRRLVSDVALGTFLSGGIDSSLVSALVHKQCGRQDLFSATIAFSGDDKSEHHTAAKTAKILGTNHHCHIFDDADLLTLPPFDEPNGDRSCLPTYLLSKFTREHVTVALSGDGGDELFGGYGRYVSMMRAGVTDPAVIEREYYSKHLGVFGGWHGGVSPIWAHPGRHILHGLRQLDFNGYLPGCVLSKVDRMSMRHALEVRSPFFAPDVLDLAARLPVEYLIGSNTKMVLRAILSKYLPPEIVNLPKRGFGMPPAVFDRNKPAIMQMMQDARETMMGMRYFAGDSDAVDNLMRSAMQNINAAWSFIVFGHWARNFPVSL